MGAGRGRPWAAVLVAFPGTGAGAVVLILVWAPTASPARLVAFLASMFATTAGIVTAAVLWGGEGRGR
jgi:hypothetical protein